MVFIFRKLRHTNFPTCSSGEGSGLSTWCVYDRKKDASGKPLNPKLLYGILSPTCKCTQSNDWHALSPFNHHSIRYNYQLERKLFC